MKIKIKTAVKLSEVWDMFLLEKRAEGKSEVCLEGYQVNVQKLINFVGDIDSQSLTKQQVQLLFNEFIKKPIAPRTIQSYTSSICIFLNWCEKHGYTHVGQIKSYKAPETTKQTYSDDDLKKILAKPNLKKCDFCEFRDWVIVNLLMDCGCRAGTIRQLKIQCVDFDNGLIQFNHTKNKKALTVPISHTMQCILKEYLSIRGGEPNDFLFPTETNTQIKPDAFSQSIRRYNRKRGVKLGSTHAFRHTFAKKYLLDCGGNAFTLQKILGHSTLDMTKHYCNIFNADLTKDYDKFSPLANMKNERIKVK